MKKIFSLMLCFAMLIGLVGCGNEEAPAPSTAPKRDYSMFAGIVADTQTWYNELMALPIANENMTEQELRQLCVDAMRMNLTFTWTPTMDINYSFTLLERTSEVTLLRGTAYSGMFYCNNNARGNVWKALNYYDHETGAMDIEAMGGDMLSVMSSACARGVEWGWSRVSNSHGLETMTSYSQYNSNVIPVGPYTYPIGKYSFGSGSGTKDIIADNGEDVMLQSYAAMQLADGLYSSSSYHVIMASSNPVIVYDEEGKIDAEESYILINEQDAIGSKTEKKNYEQENGKTMRPLGTVDNKYTFRDLLDKGYVPFTLPELVGQDPVEAGDAWLGSQDSRLENGMDIARFNFSHGDHAEQKERMDMLKEIRKEAGKHIAILLDTKGPEIVLSDLMDKTLFANYAICTLELEVRTPDGQVLVRHTGGNNTTPHTFHSPISNPEFEQDADAYANGKNTVHVLVRLSTGELKEAFQTVLKVG